MANAPLTTYLNLGKDMGVIREDLLDLITDLSPDSTPLMTMLGTSTANGQEHDWPEDYMSRPTSVSVAAEGAEASSNDLAAVARRRNWTGIVNQVVSVSGSAEKADFAGMSDPMAYYKKQGLTKLKLKSEFMLVNGARACGASGSARQSDGINSVITTSNTLASGISFEESHFNDMAQNSWNLVGDNLFDLVLTGGTTVRKISSWTAGNTRYIDASDKKLVRPVQVYESDFGVHRIMKHMDVYHAATSLHLLAIKEENYKVAYFRQPFWKELASTGDYTWGEYIAELCLETRSERASAKIYGYL